MLGLVNPSVRLIADATGTSILAADPDPASSLNPTPGTRTMPNSCSYYHTSQMMPDHPFMQRHDQY